MWYKLLQTLINIKLKQLFYFFYRSSRKNSEKAVFLHTYILCIILQMFYLQYRLIIIDDFEAGKTH